MKRLLLLATLAVFGILLAHSQDTPSPTHPVIVKRLVLKNQTTAGLSGAVPFFTPDHDGFYRVTALIQPLINQGLCSQTFCDALTVYSTGTHWYITATANSTGGSGVGAFVGTAGATTLSYSTQITAGPNGVDPYDVVIVVEEL